MSTHTTIGRLHTLIWVLIYGGLLTLVLGLAVHRHDGSTALGLGLAIAGGTVAAIGFVLIFVRARIRPDKTS